VNVHLILVPYDTALRGWRMGAGPEHLVAAGLVPHIESLGHRVRLSQVAAETGRQPAEIRTAFELMRGVAEQVRAAVAAGAFPLVLSGNCNTAAGTLAGLTPLRRAVCWFDAHGDFNTPESTATGFLDGTALATAIGRCWRQLTAAIPGFAPLPERDVMLLGSRDLDPEEARQLGECGAQVLPPADCRSRLAGALGRLEPGIEAGYVHCDLDVLDPAEGQANLFPVAGGLSVAEVEAAIGAIGRAVPVRAAAVTAYAPEVDRDGRVCKAAFRIIAALLASAAPAGP
jgi:arginase